MLNISNSPTENLRNFCLAGSRRFLPTELHGPDVDEYINDLVPRVAEGLLSYLKRAVETKSFLASLDLGDPAAENEFTKLSEYSVETDEFHKVLAGEIRVVVGRKGSGKSALFFRVRWKTFGKPPQPFPADIVNEIGLEIRDVFAAAEDIPYYFIGAKPRMTISAIRSILDQTPLVKSEYDVVIDALMWFGFLGILQPKDGNIEETYIYDVFYDMKKLQYLVGGVREGQTKVCIHPAFWPFLGIEET